MDAILTERRTAVFHDVWLAALAAADRLTGWSVASADARTGAIVLLTADLLGRNAEPAELRIALDALGLTVISLAVPGDSGAAARGRIRRRGPRLMRRIDRALAHRTK